MLKIRWPCFYCQKNKTKHIWALPENHLPTTSSSNLALLWLLVQSPLLPLTQHFTAWLCFTRLSFTRLCLSEPPFQSCTRVALCVEAVCSVYLDVWWDKINTANRILLPPSCFHSAALCILPPPFVPSPSAEGVAATISLHQRRPSPLCFLKLRVCCVLLLHCFTHAFYWRRVCVHHAAGTHLAQVHLPRRGRGLKRTVWGRQARLGVIA